FELFDHTIRNARNETVTIRADDSYRRRMAFGIVENERQRKEATPQVRPMTPRTPNARAAGTGQPTPPQARERRSISSTRRVLRLLEDGAQFGKYQVVRLIARGGMSEVYEVIHIGLKKPMALKV